MSEEGIGLLSVNSSSSTKTWSCSASLTSFRGLMEPPYGAAAQGRTAVHSLLLLDTELVDAAPKNPAALLPEDVLGGVLEGVELGVPKKALSLESTDGGSMRACTTGSSLKCNPHPASRSPLKRDPQAAAGAPFSVSNCSAPSSDPS